MKDVLDYRLEVAAMRGLRVKALKVTVDELYTLLLNTPVGTVCGLQRSGWTYKGIPLQALDRA
jgi:hypothetical protein